MSAISAIRWGRDYELMLPLDADSLMDGATIVRLVRGSWQAYPKLGILQSLVVGASVAERASRACSSSACARHAALHDGQRVVGGRLRPVLGAQRAWCASRRSRSIATCRSCPAAAAWRPHPVARSGRSDADAPRRIRGAGAAAGVRELGGESADRARVHPPRPALVPGQHAVLSSCLACPGCCR